MTNCNTKGKERNFFVERLFVSLFGRALFWLVVLKVPSSFFLKGGKKIGEARLLQINTKNTISHPSRGIL